MLQLMASMSSVGGAESLQDIWAMMESGLSPRPATPRCPNVDSMCLIHVLCICNFFLCHQLICIIHFPPFVNQFESCIVICCSLFTLFDIRTYLFISVWCVNFSTCSGLICVAEYLTIEFLILISFFHWSENSNGFQGCYKSCTDFRVDFKMATLVYLSLSGMAPPYLASDCQLVSDEGRRQLRSANSRTCVVRWTCSSCGDRCFATAGPRLWKSLPAHLKQTYINFEQFKRQLKTFLFGRWDCGALWLLLNCAFLNNLTYLLILFWCLTEILFIICHSFFFYF